MTNRRGRPANETKYSAMISKLKQGGATAKQMSEELEIPIRTVYTYLEKAEDQGHIVIKVGHSFNSPYRIVEN